MDPDGDGTGEDTVRVWLVERTYSDDELNLIVLTYATPDGEYEFRKERALPSFTGSSRETRASLEVTRDNLAAVSDPERRERFATEAARMADKHDVDDAI